MTRQVVVSSSVMLYQRFQSYHADKNDKMSHKISLLFRAISNQSRMLDIRTDRVGIQANDSLEHDTFATLLTAIKHISYDYDRANLATPHKMHKSIDFTILKRVRDTTPLRVPVNPIQYKTTHVT